MHANWNAQLLVRFRGGGGYETVAEESGSYTFSAGERTGIEGEFCFDWENVEGVKVEFTWLGDEHGCPQGRITGTFDPCR